MTIVDYIDEVILMGVRYNIDVKSNSGLIASQVNKARQEVVRQFINLCPHNFGDIITLTNSDTTNFETPRTNINLTEYQLPGNVLNIYNVVASWVDTNGLTRRVQLRPQTSMEFYGTLRTWNTPTRLNPVYFVQNKFDQTINTAILNTGIIARASDYNQFINVSFGKTDPRSDLSIILEIYATCVPDDLEYNDITNNPSIEVAIPKYLEHLVILYTLLYVYELLNETSYLEIIKADVKYLSSLVMRNFELNMSNQIINLPSKEGA